MTWSCNATGHTEGEEQEREALEAIPDALKAAHAGSITLVGNFYRAEFEQAGFVLKKTGGGG